MTIHNELKTVDQMDFEERTAVMRGMEAEWNGENALSCPHDPTNSKLMNAWLQGYVTAGETPETAREIYETL